MTGSSADYGALVMAEIGKRGKAITSAGIKAP
jgi:hypothetical protein